MVDRGHDGRGATRGGAGADSAHAERGAVPAVALGLRPYRRALVVANPISGRGLALRAANELRLGLERYGVPAALYQTRARRDAFARLRTLDQETDLVVAVGGDGTVREVIDGLVDPDIHVGILPFGTANVLANEFGLPRDIHHALEILCRKRVHPIDVAYANGQLSFLAVGVGFDALAVRELERRRRGPISKLAYVGAIARALPAYRPPRLRVVLDGKAVDGEYGFVLVGNLLHYAGFLHLAPDARCDDGLLEVYLFETGSRRELARAFLRGVFGHLPGHGVTLRRASRVRVESSTDAPIPVQVDGDLAGETPVDVELGPNRYRLVVP